MASGGKRLGSGRPVGSGKFGEPTKAIRLPESLIKSVQEFVARKAYQIPLYSSKVRAGFPSPADDHIESNIDLNQHLITHPAATFFVRVVGNSMVDAGIYEGDILIVDKSLTPAHNKIVIAAINGELTVKRLQIKNGKKLLCAENPRFKTIELKPENDNYIWGVVVHAIHSF